MNGLQLRESYWKEVASPELEKLFPAHFSRMAVGALGHGSEFLGLDDEFSRDHDWGPGFTIFLTEKDYPKIAADVFRAITSLPQEYQGYHPFWGTTPGTGRNGVRSFLEWLQRQRILDAVPQEDEDWLNISEYQLLWATNGNIWHDPLGEVSRIRKRLSYYPDSVWRKRIALKCHQLHQTGTYQTSRFMKRDDQVTVDVSLHKFTIHAMQMYFLLRRQYAPIYKWLHTMFKDLPDIPCEVKEAILKLCSPMPVNNKLHCVKLVMGFVQDELEGFCPSVQKHRGSLLNPDPFALMQVAQEINASIADPDFRNINYLLQAGAWTDN